MDYITLKRGKPKMECYAAPDKLFVFRRAYPWCCEDGWCLADP